MSQSRIPLPLFRTILYATDLSERARAAFDVACALAREEATRLIVLHVSEPVPSMEQLVGYGELGVPVFLPKELPPGPDVLQEQLARQFTPSMPIPVEYAVRHELPADQIVHIAEQSGCDLIVMGTHGRTGLDRLLMGSVAEAVVRRAPCPVVTVRSVAPYDGPKALRTILLATDFSRESEAALRVARVLARDHGARLVLTHVVEPDLALSSIPPTPAEVTMGREALESLRDRTEGKDLKCPVEIRLREGDPVREVLAVAAELSSDLIVMGTHGRTGLERALMGSVAESVTRGAVCAVLTIKWLVAAGTARELLRDHKVEIGHGNQQAGRQDQ